MEAGTAMIQGMIRAYWSWRARGARRTLARFEATLTKEGYKRQEKRQFWKAFVKSGSGIITKGGRR